MNDSIIQNKINELLELYPVTIDDLIEAVEEVAMWRDAVGSVSLHETLWYNKSFPMTPAVVSHTFDCYCETGLNDDGIN